RLAPALVARQPLAELSEMVADCLRQMPTEPRVVVRVADELVDSLQAQIDEIAAASGFAGKLVLLGEPGLAPGDRRAERADGGAALLAQIDAAVDRYCRGQRALAAERAAAPAADPAPAPAPAQPATPPEAAARDDEFESALPALSRGGAAI